MTNAGPSRPLSGHPNRKVREIDRRRIVFEGKGFMRHPEDWSKAVARHLAGESGLPELNQTHWQVVRFMRDYYFYHGRAPMNRDLKSGLSMTLMALEALFPVASGRASGLPNPKSCVG